MAEIPQLSPAEAQALLQRLGTAGHLLDVRENWEYALTHVEGSLHVPMDQVPLRLAELNPDHTYAVLCHHGRRSQQVAGLLSTKGYKVVNVTGGIEAWAATLDPDISRY